ncbi:MAG TPA: hypothetical protein DCS82_08065, partial [Rhodospirillaceae bacterium]|nr:hypothetical protein [Rhodospirillaceae bacterium]
MNLRAAIATAATLALSVFLLVAWAPTIIQTASGDPAYTYAYHHMFSAGAVYGRDVVHTGGPWSILYYSEFHPDTFWYVIAGQAVFALVLGWSLAVIGRDYVRNPWLAIPFVLVSLGLLTVAPDARFFLAGCLAALLTPDFSKQRWSAVHLALLATMACAVSVKNTFLVAGLVLVVQQFVLEGFFARRVPWHAIFFVAVAVIFFVAGGQPPSAIPGFVATLFDAASASSEFLVETGALWEWIAYLSIAVLFMGLVFDAEYRTRGWKGVVRFAAIGAILFLSYKSGFVRQDGQHVIRAFCVILPLIAIYVFVHADDLRPVLANWISGLKEGLPAQTAERVALVTVAAIVVAGLAAIAMKYPSLYANKLERLAEQARGVAAVFTTGRSTYISRHEAAKSAIRKEFPIADVNGSLAVYSSLQTVGLARGNYRYLPIAAAQLNWTPKLDKITAQFFTGENAPEYVVGQTPYTAREAGLAILTNYAPLNESSSVDGINFIMRRVGNPRRVSVTPLGNRQATWGDRISVPKVKSGLVRARIKYERNLLGYLTSFFYQPPAVVMRSFDGQ